jgi:hypothetical protein
MQMPTAWLSLFDQVFILALIPLMNGIIYPTLDKIGVRVSLLTRIGKYFQLCLIMGREVYLMTLPAFLCGSGPQSITLMG